MRRCAQMMLGIAGALLLSGCRTATRVTEMSRVDLDLSSGGGNRGYLVGTPPPPGELKTTREMVETTIEVPSFYQPKRVGPPSGLEGIAPPETGIGEENAQEPAEAGALGRYDTYVVQKGDSLWSIAAKPEIYGKATRWRRIFDANRDLLKSPDRVRPGMTLKIPREGGGGSSTTYDDEGITSKK